MISKQLYQIHISMLIFYAAAIIVDLGTGRNALFRGECLLKQVQ